MDLCAKSGIKYETFVIIYLLYFSTEVKRFIKSIRRQASRSLYNKNISIASGKQKSILHKGSELTSAPVKDCYREDVQ